MEMIKKRKKEKKSLAFGLTVASVSKKYTQVDLPTYIQFLLIYWKNGHINYNYLWPLLKDVIQCNIYT